MIDRLLSFVAPLECVACFVEGGLLCRNCEAALRTPSSICFKCRTPTKASATCAACRPRTALSSIHAACVYQGAAKDVVWKLKFGRVRSGGAEIAAIIARRLRLSARITAWTPAMRSNVVITHAPTANNRVRMRGYDQAELIAKGLARQTGLRHTTLLQRHGSQEQIGANRRQRASQLTDAFSVLRGRQLRGAHVILVDDVCTTGATLESAARALRDAGAKRVDAIVFAQA